MQLSPGQFLATHQVFSRADLECVVQERTGAVNKSTINNHLASWQRQGRITQIKRGVYIHTDKIKSVDPFVVASKLTADAVLSYHAAFELHGFAQSYFNQVHYTTLTLAKELSFQGILYTPVKPRPSIRKVQFHSKWVELVDRSGSEILVTTLERTLVEALDRIELVGGVEELWRSICSIPALNYRKLEQYVALLDRPTVVARLGFFLEHKQDELSVPKALLNRLEGMAPRSKVYFRRKEKGEKIFLSRWNLVVPQKLIDSRWEGV